MPRPVLKRPAGFNHSGACKSGADESRRPVTSLVALSTEVKSPVHASSDVCVVGRVQDFCNLFRGLQVADAPLARQPADAKPAALAGEGRSSAASGKPARLGGTARRARTEIRFLKAGASNDG